MSATGLAIIYIIIWWIVFFTILPIDVNRQKSIKIDGEDAGSPENPKMLKKFIYCTGITTVIFVIIYLLIKYEYLNLRYIINLKCTFQSHSFQY
jgi:predicted secreted protein